MVFLHKVSIFFVSFLSQPELLRFLNIRNFEKLFLSIDDCDHTGDHENYFKNINEAYEIDGTKYENCDKVAVRYRSKNEHKPLSKLTKYSFLLFDGFSYRRFFQNEFYGKTEILNPKFS